MRQEALEFVREINSMLASRIGLRLRQATVQSTQAGSITIRFAGSATNIAGVKYLSSYSPTANDVIWLLQSGPDLLVLGKLA